MNQGNDGFIACWNEVLVPKWNRFRHILSGNGKIHSDRALEWLAVRPGDKVLDVGCGYGETCLQLAERVGPKGQVVGIDCTSAFLEIARQELAESSFRNVEYILGDAQRYPLKENEFDIAFSRFGVMFFENRVQALRNMHRSLKPGGKLMLIVWRRLQENYCWNVGKSIALRYLKEPEELSMTCGPGPFSMGSEEVTRGMLTAAGFQHVDLFKQYDADVFMGKDLEEAIDFQILVGPSGELIRESKEKGKEALPKIREDLRKELATHLKGQEVWMPSSSWLILATK